MKKLKVVLILCLSCLFYACNKQISYKKYQSPNGSFTIEVPSMFKPNQSFGDYMSFVANEGKTTLFVRKTESNSISSLCHRDKGKFDYNIFQSDDTTLFYKWTKGANVLFSAYDLNMLKYTSKGNYLIHYEDITGSKNQSIEIICHIYNSLMLNGGEKNTQKQDEISMKKYENGYFYIEYPSDWGFIEHLTEISDVTFSSYAEQIASDITRFDTDYNLEEIHEEETYECRINPDWHLVSEEKAMISGRSCYKTIIDYELNGKSYRKINYTTKCKNTMYSVSFGNTKDMLEKYNNVVDKMVESFKIK